MNLGIGDDSALPGDAFHGPTVYLTLPLSRSAVYTRSEPEGGLPPFGAS